VTHKAGAEFRDVVVDLTNLGQTFPPVAVFTLAVPILGFGVLPTVVALTMYGVLPVLQNTVAGMQSVAPAVLESAHAMGMGSRQTLVRVELPLAAPVILAGVRVSVVINVATATIGAIAGAGGLGAPIISGLILADPAVTLQGAILTAALALILDGYLGAFERASARSVGIQTR
jgi:osmoprotectant transport system permease protein